MQRFALVLVLGLAAGARAQDVQPEAAARAKAVEMSAFAAVDREHWCTALDLFLEANAIVANADLVFNAAQAAEFAGDRARAVQLYTELLGHAPTAARKSASKKKIKTLTAMVEKNGAGPSCPPPEKKPVVAVAPPTVEPVVSAPAPVDATVPPVATVTPPPAPVETADATTAPVIPPVAHDASAEPAPSTTTTVVVEALAPEHEAPTMADAKVAPTWPWITAGVGGAVAILGGIGVVVGTGQYVAFSAAVSDQERTDDRSSAEFADASRRRDFYAETWNQWGAPLAISSGVVLAGGVIAAGVGGAFVAME